MTDVTNFEVHDRVAHITLNRPKAMNALNPELRWALSKHFDEVETNDEIWLAVVTGAGDRMNKMRCLVCRQYTVVSEDGRDKVIRLTPLNSAFDSYIIDKNMQGHIVGRVIFAFKSF